MFVFAMQEEDDLGGGSYQAIAGRQKKKRGLFLRIFFPLIVMIGDFISVMPLGQRREIAKKRLVQAGVPGGLSVDQFFACYVIGTVLGFVVGAYIDSELATAPMFMIV